MDAHRLPQICLNRLLHLHHSNLTKIEYNWISQFNIFLEKINMTHLLETPIAAVWIENENLAFERFNRHLKTLDMQSCLGFSHMNCLSVRRLEDGAADYLLLNSNYHISRIIIQLRLSTKYNLRFCSKGTIYTIDQNVICLSCNMQVKETLSHFLCECPSYLAYRSHFLQPLIDIANHLNANPLIIVSCLDSISIKKIYYYIINSLKLRAFLRDE